MGRGVPSRAAGKVFFMGTSTVVVREGSKLPSRGYLWPNVLLLFHPSASKESAHTPLTPHRHALD
jgi:hypothetical protein